MKILHVLQTLDANKGGGITARNLKLIEYLENKNYQNFILTLNKKSEFIGIKNIPKKRVFNLYYLNERFPIPSPNVFKISSLIKDMDIVHLTSFWTLLNAYAYIFCKIFSKKYVICPAGSLLVFGRSKFLKYFYNFFFGNNIIKDSSAIIAITEKEVEQFISKNIPKEKISKIPNGVELFNFNKVNLNKDKLIKFEKFSPYILYVGRLNFIKGPDILLQAFDKIANQIPEYNLIFAGNDDGMGKELMRLAKESQFSKRIKFVGFIKGINKENLYKNANLLVIPSRSEAMSLVVLEAAYYGLESIFTDQCGLEELENKSLGKSVPVDINLLAESIKGFIHLNKQKKVNIELIKYVSNNFSWEKISNQYLKVFNDSYKK
tara:strand:- start:3696 stop:4826 length:1131 start_codon:yes stop_codon:yes gene_type:complete